MRTHTNEIQKLFDDRGIDVKEGYYCTARDCPTKALATSEVRRYAPRIQKFYHCTKEAPVLKHCQYHHAWFETSSFSSRHRSCSRSGQSIHNPQQQQQTMNHQQFSNQAFPTQYQQPGYIPQQFIENQVSFQASSANQLPLYNQQFIPNQSHFQAASNQYNFYNQQPVYIPQFLQHHASMDCSQAFPTHPPSVHMLLNRVSYLEQQQVYLQTVIYDMLGKQQEQQTLKGFRIILEPFGTQHLEEMKKLYEDNDIMRFYEQGCPHAGSDWTNYYRNTIIERLKSKPLDNRWWMVKTIGGSYAGAIGFSFIPQDATNPLSHFKIYMGVMLKKAINGERLWGNKTCYEMLWLLYDFYSNTYVHTRGRLGQSSISVDIHPENDPSISLAEAFGLQTDGKVFMQVGDRTGRVYSKPRLNYHATTDITLRYTLCQKMCMVGEKVKLALAPTWGLSFQRTIHEIEPFEEVDEDRENSTVDDPINNQEIEPCEEVDEDRENSPDDIAIYEMMTPVNPKEIDFVELNDVLSF